MRSHGLGNIFSRDLTIRDFPKICGTVGRGVTGRGTFFFSSTSGGPSRFGKTETGDNVFVCSRVFRVCKNLPLKKGKRVKGTPDSKEDRRGMGK